MASAAFPTRLGGETRSSRAFVAVAGLALRALVIVAATAAALAPKTTLLLVVGGIVVGTILLRIDIAVMVLAATAPLETEFSNYGGASVTKIVGALCLASFFVDTIRRRRVLHFDRSHAVVFGLLAIAMISTVHARDQTEAVSTTIRYASFAAVYFILSQVGTSRELVKRLIWALAVASTYAAILALDNYSHERTVVATLKNSNATDFAFILVTTLPLAFWLLGGRRWLRPAVVAMIATLCTATALSLSRSAVVGVAVGIAVFVITDRRRVPVVIGGGLIAITAAVLVIHSNPARFQNALLYKERVAEVNVSTRLDAWHAAARLAGDHPLLGIGPGNFREYFNEATDRPPGTYNILVVHDAYLDVAAEVGFVAAILFLLYVGIIYARLTDVVRSRRDSAALAQALRISLVIAATASIFISEQYFLPFWLIGGLATAIWRDMREREGDAAAAAT